MAPNPRVAKAFHAMRDIGITEEKVKPVLKSLLKLYEKNWELIEEENYRALADAIFDMEEAQAAEQKKKVEITERVQALEEENLLQEEPERPLKRLRLRHQESQPSPSCSNPSTISGGTLLKRPKLEEDELVDTRPLHQSRGITAMSEHNLESSRNESQPVSLQPLSRNKGRQHVSPNTSAPQERSDLSQQGASERTQPDVTKKPESDLTVFQKRLKDKGKEPLLPETSPTEQRLSSERPATGICLKEPKVEPAVGLLPKQKSLALVKPKDEPFTDDVPCSELPIAVIRPEESFQNEDSVRGQDYLHPQITKSAENKDISDIVSALSCEVKNGYDLANTPDETSSKVEIASSPAGEVKIFLSCNSAGEKPVFGMNSVDELLKTVEERCLGSYKALDPNISVKKLMKDMCECLLELRSFTSNESRVGINVTQPFDSLKKCCAADAVGTDGIPCSASNGSVNVEGDDEEPEPQVPRFALPCNGVDGIVEHVTESLENHCENDMYCDQNGSIDTDSLSVVVVEQENSIPDDSRSLADVNDIAKGEERVIISLVNEINNESPPSFHYIPQNAVFQNAYVNFSLARIGDDNCCSGCFGNCLSTSTSCACSLQTGGEFAYTLGGLVREELLNECISMNREPQKHCLFYCKDCPLERSKSEDIIEPCKGHLVRSFIKECWLKCGCSKQCGNRVVQRGITHKLQVFMTRGKGWGLRTLEDLPKGAFVCEYVGEVLTNAELYERVSRSSNKDEHAYPVLLDADWGAESELKDEEALCLDATYYGNVARFINHRCFDSTLVEIPVEIETPDHHYYHLAFFTTRKVKALEELTWDYGIDFDDDEHPVKAFQCRCGSKFCRNIKRPSRSRSGSRRR